MTVLFLAQPRCATRLRSDPDPGRGGLRRGGLRQHRHHHPGYAPADRLHALRVQHRGLDTQPQRAFTLALAYQSRRASTTCAASSVRQVAPMVMGDAARPGTRRMSSSSASSRRLSVTACPLSATAMASEAGHQIAMGVLRAEAMQVRAGQRVDLAGQEWHRPRHLSHRQSLISTTVIVADIDAAQDLAR
jgi:hypothetical protein